MRVAGSVMLAGLALLALGAGAAPARAQQTRPLVQGRLEPFPQPRRVVRRAPVRIQVTPNQRLYRQCEDWLALEHRPSGDVITPQMRCWWAIR